MTQHLASDNQRFFVTFCCLNEHPLCFVDISKIVQNRADCNMVPAKFCAEDTNRLLIFLGCLWKVAQTLVDHCHIVVQAGNIHMARAQF